MADARPLTLEDVAPAFARVIAPGSTGIVLAVSGGPDSMALLHCAAGLRERGAMPPLHVGTVDHGLRSEAAADGARVAEAAGRLGLPCSRLFWSGTKPVRSIQERARAARYALLTGLCARVGADHLVTAHTADDQAETVLFRLLRGSGLAGLAGMRSIATRAGVRLARPLLAFPKARLIATCAAAGAAIVHDPSNADPRFARARLRRLLPLLAEEGCDAATLARLADRAARAEDALTFAADAAFARSRLPLEGTASLRLDAATLRGLPPALAVRVLAQAIVAAGGAANQLQRLERLAERLGTALAAASRVRATLGGTVLDLSPEGVLTLRPEAPRRPARPRAAATVSIALSGSADFPWQG